MSYVIFCFHENRKLLPFFKLFQKGSNSCGNLRFFNFDIILPGEYQKYQFQRKKCNFKTYFEI